MASLWRSSWFPPALLGAGLAALYGAMALPTVGPGDSGELAAAMCCWGVAHPPGFPLLSLLGNLVTHLPHPGEPAYALNLLNALFAALACAVLARAAGVLTGQAWAGVAAGLVLGTSRVFWEYALVLEVFSLNALLAALLLLCVAEFLRGREAGTRAPWVLPAAAAAMAGVVTHHTTLVLLAAPVAVVLGALARPARPRVASRPVIVAFALGLAPLLYLPIAASLDPPMNWGNPRSPAAILYFLLRRDFGTGTLMAPAIVANEVLANGLPASPLGNRHLWRFLADLPHALGWPALALAAAGLVWCARRSRPLLMLSLLFFGAIVLFYSRVNAPLVPLYLGIARPFAILPHLFLAFLAGLGLGGLMKAVHGRGAAAAAMAAVLGLGGLGIASHLRGVNPHGNTFTRDFGINFMAGMPEHAIVFSNGDYFRNSFQYARLGLRRREDLDFVEQPLMATPWYVEQLRRRRALRLPGGMTAYGADPAARSSAWLDLNLPERPIATVGFLDNSWERDYTVLPMGLWLRVERRERRLDVREWSKSYARAVSLWSVTSLAREYPAESWEGSQGAFYPYALGSLRALLDVDAMLRDAPPPSPAIPALAAAERWTGARRAEYIAQQADLWRLFLTDSLVPLPAARESVVAGRAVTLAREALAIAPEQLQALRTLAAVMRAGAVLPGARRFHDPPAELETRQRIVALRPGDWAEVGPYLALARSLAGGNDARLPPLLSRAEYDRRRCVDLVNLCLRIAPSPALERRRDESSTPIEAPRRP